MRIAFLFLTIGELNHPKIWKSYFKDADPSSYKIYAHSKNPPNSNTILKQISKTVPTKWGDISLVKATLFLLAEALIDDCDMYILLSESTVPFKSYNYLQNFLSDQKNRMGVIQRVKDHDDLYKSSQWFIFNKETVKNIVSLTSKYIDDPQLSKPSSLGAPDELYFATIVRREGIPVIEEQTTYYKFKGVDYKSAKLKLDNIYEKYRSNREKMTQKEKNNFKKMHNELWENLKDAGKHPISFDNITENDLLIFSRPNLLFGRKFVKKSNIIDYLVKEDKFVGLTGMIKHHPYLVIVPTGSDTVQRNFLDREKRRFDLAIVYYGDNKEDENLFKEQSEYFIKAKGPKWKLVGKALNTIQYQQYQKIWIPDDDLKVDVEDVNLMFDITDKDNLNLSQPSLGIPNYDQKELQKVLKLVGKPIDQITISDLYQLRNNHPKDNKTINKILYRISWYHQLKQGDKIRETHFVEVQSPIMSPEVISILWKYINSDITEAGFGLDDIWNKIIDKKYIIDQITVEHTRDIGYLKYSKFEKGKMNKSDLPNHFKVISKSPDQERVQIMRYFDFLKPYLLIIPTGNNTCFDFSKDRDKQNFDVCIIYYGEGEEDRFKKQCKYFFKLRGPKWFLIKNILQQIEWKLYDYIWIPDDDLIVSTEKINEMFQVADENNLKLCQPAVSIPGLPWKDAQEILHLAPKNKLYSSGYLRVLREKYPDKEKIINKILYRVSYPELIRQSESQIIRKTNMIEIQMPLLSKRTLVKLYSVITDPVVQTGFGIDIIWNKWIKDKYVIDYIEVVHTRDIGYMKVIDYQKGKIKFNDLPEQYKHSKNSPKIEQYKLLDKYLKGYKKYKKPYKKTI
jgi:hypothetical protein